jgi:hypothetical protein
MLRLLVARLTGFVTSLLKLNTSTRLGFGIVMSLLSLFASKHGAVVVVAVLVGKTQLELLFVLAVLVVVVERMLM